MKGSLKSQSGEHSITKRLHGIGITRVALVDDAYDSPSVNALNSGEIDDFWGRIERDRDLIQELASYKEGVSSADDIDDRLLISLWDNIDNLKKLREPCINALFANRLAMKGRVDKIAEHFRTLGLEIETVGSEGLPDRGTKLVFIDYILNPAAIQDRGRRATEKAKEIYGRIESDAEKPFIVLMSEQPDAKAQQETFRKESGLLAGLFGFRPKEDLLEADRLYVDLTTWSIDMPARHSIQHFIETLAKSLNDASKQFIERIKELSFEDYANIQYLSLQPDGQPLGEYILWLYKSYLLHLVHDKDEVISLEKKLDELSFNKYYPSQSLPSTRLAEIYRCALTEPGVGKLEAHPWSSKKEKEPYIQFGDIFRRKGSLEVLVVINAPCDLAYAPGSSRPFPKERSIFHEHGTLVKLSEVLQANLCRTELFEHEGEAYRIIWDHRQVISKKYGEVWQWLKEEKYERIARLKLPFALDVQQVFASNLTRIGMPVKPPFYKTADVEVYCEGPNGECLLLDEPIKGGAFLALYKVGGDDNYLRLFSLSGDCILQVKRRLAKAREALEQQRGVLLAQVEKVSKRLEGGRKEKERVSGELKGTEGKIQKIVQLQELDRVFLPMVREAFKLPKAGKPVDKKLLWIYSDMEFEGKYFPNAPIALNIRCGD